MRWMIQSTTKVLSLKIISSVIGILEGIRERFPGSDTSVKLPEWKGTCEMYKILF